MKRLQSLRVLTGALLAFACGGALAQGAVLYGAVDVGVLYKTTPGAASGGTWQMDSDYTPRFGFRGNEPLAGGVRALYQLETEVKADSGGGTFFMRESWVGFDGPYGLVRFGRTKDVFDDLSGRILPFGPTSQPGLFIQPAWRAGVVAARFSNSATYTSPKWRGLQVQAQVGLDESTSGDPGWATTVSWEGHGVEVMAAADGAVVTTGNVKQPTAWLVGGSYRFGGMVKLGAAYTRGDTNRAATGTNEGIIVGAEAPFGAWTAKAAYGRLDNSVSGVTADTYALGADYALSKRTSLYGRLVRDVATDVNVVMLGTTHRF